MTSQKQIEANRRNVSRSTGARTDRGRAIVARNALRHGLTAERILLPDETQEDLARLVDQLRLHFRPVGAAEVLLVERITASMWRLRRVYRIEARVLAWQFHRELVDRAEKEADRFRRDPDADLLNALCSATDETKQQDALRRPADAAARPDAEDTAVSVAFVRDAGGANALPKLSRYEAAIERSMYRAMHELERLQAIGGRLETSDASEAREGGLRVLDAGSNGFVSYTPHSSLAWQVIGMGGYRSGRWGGHTRKATVEECCSLDVSYFRRKGMLTQGQAYSTRLWWKGEHGHEVASLGVVASAETVVLSYTIAWASGDREPEDICYTVPVVWTPCNYGGQRPWFLCPGRGLRVPRK